MKILVAEFIDRTKLNLPLSYTATTLAVLFAFVVQAVLTPDLEGSPFLLLAAPVTVSSFLFGRGAGFYATSLGTLLGLISMAVSSISTSSTKASTSANASQF